MELAFRNGDYVSDGAAQLCRVQGQEELLQRVLFRLTARRGMFPFMEDLGSQLWKLGQLPPSARLAAARQYVAEALENEDGLTVESVSLEQTEEGAAVTARLAYGGESLSVTVNIGG